MQHRIQFFLSPTVRIQLTLAGYTWIQRESVMSINVTGQIKEKKKRVKEKEKKEKDERERETLVQVVQYTMNK